MLLPLCKNPCAKGIAYFSVLACFKTFCSCHRVPGVSILILHFWLPRCTQGFSFCMHILTIMSAFYPMQQHTNSTSSILAISPPPPFQGCTLGFGFCMHILTIMSAFYPMQQHSNSASSILAISPLPLPPSRGAPWGLVFACISL